MIASISSAFLTLSIYFVKGMQSVNEELFLALMDIFLFWFAILWNVALLLALFRSLKYIFHKCYGGYKIELYSCQKEKIVEIGYGNLVKLWRRWIMTIIWLVGAQMIVALIITKLFSSYVDIFDWFNIYILYGFVLSAGYISFILLSSRCKQVRIKKC